MLLKWKFDGILSMEEETKFTLFNCCCCSQFHTPFVPSAVCHRSAHAQNIAQKGHIPSRYRRCAFCLSVNIVPTQEKKYWFQQFYLWEWNWVSYPTFFSPSWWWQCVNVCMFAYALCLRTRVQTNVIPYFIYLYIFFSRFLFQLIGILHPITRISAGILFHIFFYLFASSVGALKHQPPPTHAIVKPYAGNPCFIIHWCPCLAGNCVLCPILEAIERDRGGILLIW